MLLRNKHTQCPKCRNYYYLMKGETYPNLKVQYDKSVSDKCHPGRLGHRHMDWEFIFSFLIYFAILI